MGIDSLNRIVRHLRVSVQPESLQPGDGVTDGELLERYRAGRDEAAFEALVRRHGPMVLGVCRRILGNHADAEDAFQATFLVLVRKAASIRRQGMVGNWLYGVAHHTALKAKTMQSRRRAKEHEARALPRANANDEAWRQAQLVVDDALARLADKYRVPIVLCDLEGRTIKEAARQLGWPQGTVASRLTRGRAILARRLTRSGLQLSAGGLALVLVPGTMSAQVPAPLLMTTLKAAGLFAVGNTIASGVVSATTLALTHGVLNAMFLSKLKIAGAILLVTAALGFGLGASGLAAPGEPLAPVAQQPAPIQAKPVELEPAVEPRVAQVADDKSPAALLRRIEAIEKRLDNLMKSMNVLIDATKERPGKSVTVPGEPKKAGIFDRGGLGPQPPPPVASVGPPMPPMVAPAGPAARPEVKVFVLQVADAVEVAATLNQFLNPDGKGPGAGRALRIAAHESSNSILVQGSMTDLEIVEAIIARLDKAATPKRKEAKK